MSGTHGTEEGADVLIPEVDTIRLEEDHGQLSREASLCHRGVERLPLRLAVPRILELGSLPPHLELPPGPILKKEIRSPLGGGPPMIL